MLIAGRCSGFFGLCPGLCTPATRESRKAAYEGGNRFPVAVICPLVHSDAASAWVGGCVCLVLTGSAL